MKRALAGGLQESDLYGEDNGGRPCNQRSLEICERGMRIHTTCNLKIQTCYKVSLSYRDDAGQARKFAVEATVVEKEMDGDGCNLVTLYFCEIPPELRSAIKDGSLIEACFNGGTVCREGRVSMDEE